MSRPLSPTHNENGFTLIETLTALTIMAAIMLVIVGIFSGALDLFKNRSKDYVDFMEIARFENRLRTDLRGTIKRIQLLENGIEIRRNDEVITYQPLTEGWVRQSGIKKTLYFSGKNRDIQFGLHESFNKRYKILSIDFGERIEIRSYPRMMKMRISLE